MQTFICQHCGAELPLEAFTRNKSKKYGINTWCKKCTSEYKTKYRVENAEKIRVAKQKCYQAKKEQYRQHHRENYLKNREKIIAQSIKWCKENKECRNASQRKHRAENLATLKELREGTDGNKINLSGTVKTEMETTEDRIRAFENIVGK